MAIAIFRFLWLRMAIRFVQAARRSETRLWYALPGPLILVAGFALVFTMQAPLLAVPLLITGSATMRVQASMVEEDKSNAFRNAAILVALWAVFLAVVKEWGWAPVSAAFAVGLFAMQQVHDKVDARHDYKSQVQAANAAARRQLGDQ